MERGGGSISQDTSYVKTCCLRLAFPPAEERSKGCLTGGWGRGPVSSSLYGLHGCSGMAFMLLFTCDLVFVVCSFPALMGNNFYLPVDILVCLETFGVITLENTNSSAKFKNFTLFTGSTFFSSLLLVLKNCLCYVNAISPTEIKIPIKIIVCFSLNENPILQTQHQLLKV